MDLRTKLKVLIVVSTIFSASLSIWYFSKERYLIESPSMMHGSAPQNGVIDKNDIVYIEAVNNDDIITYFEGKETNYKSGGTYGDVIIYNKDGIGFEESEDLGLSSIEWVPVIHRVLFWFEYEPITGNFNIPELNRYNLSGTAKVADEFPSFREGEENGPLILHLNDIKRKMGADPHSGYITKGDHNEIGQVDQYSLSDPVKKEWIIGKAVLIDSSEVFLIIGGILAGFIIDIICIVILILNREKKV